METISLQGTGEWNEDAFVAEERLGMYGVLDGATSLRPYRGDGGETGGYLASHGIKHYFESLEPAEAAQKELAELAVEANEFLGRKMAEAGIDLTDKTSLWTSCLAIVRIHDKYIEYVQAGDCMIIAFYTDGNIRVLTRDQVEAIDKRSMKAWQDGASQGITSREQLWEKVKPTILQNKYGMNTLDGYSVLSGEPELAELLEYGRINRIRLRSLLMITDGLFLPREKDDAPRSEMELLGRRIEEDGLSAYAHWLLETERQDPECRKYPRFKVSDDKTGIYIDFGQ
ncbi:protein phosphatase 2C domain-containing protein [Paenibacillus beijingensis]|uniref:protein phosphatase 2C domain-containing protein n=1 Tax=Paenibacillus beijingensis TaxID=1126833 RepID=UPI001EE6A401|nr:protein phosphatase 2C domain-containing protein [Paenibacillus beijingensis]